MIKVSEISEVVDALRSGKVVVFPTDTVWGVGVVVSSEFSIKQLYKLKKRDRLKPTAVLVGSMDVAEKLGEFDEKSLKLVHKFWPGSLTVIVKAKPGVSSLITNDEGEIGLRMSGGKFCKVLRSLGDGVVATSANITGGDDPTTRSEIDSEFLQNIDVIWDIECEGSGVSSTVVRSSENGYQILRQGDIKL